MKAFKLFSAAALTAALLSFASAASAQTYPNAAEAITLSNAINNNTVAIRNLGNNNAQIAYYLPRMAVCIPPYTTAKNNMDAEIAYYAGGGRDVAVLNGYRAQVGNALLAGRACAQEHTPSEVFAANGVKYTIYGYPSNTFINTVKTRVNNMPAVLKAKVAAAAVPGAGAGVGWKFYLIRSLDDLAASPLASLPGMTPARIAEYRTLGAFTDRIFKIQVFFETYNPYYDSVNVNNPHNKDVYSVLTGTNISAAVAHENEHLNDVRLNRPSQAAAFTNAYNAGVAAYNAAGASKDPDIARNFIRDATHGGTATSKEELFAELAAYWDTAHWGVTGQTATMSSKAYLPTDVVRYFSAAWTLMQNNKMAGTW